MFYWGDTTFIIVIPAFILAMYAQFKVKNTFNKYQKVLTKSGLTGADVARRILDSNGLHDVAIEPVRGNLTDHYDPRQKVVRLSDSVYSKTSVAAIGVAAHETGHAIQHKDEYAPLVIRNSFVPVASIGSSAGPYLAIIGLIFSLDILVNVGILLFTAAVAFYLITLPVEFNASSRAISTLERTGVLTVDEITPAKKVLRAAALTYVASAAVAIANLIRLVLLANRRD